MALSGCIGELRLHPRVYIGEDVNHALACAVDEDVLPPPRDVTFDSHKSECASSRGFPRCLSRDGKGERWCLPNMQGFHGEGDLSSKFEFSTRSWGSRSSNADFPNLSKEFLLTSARRSCQSVIESFVGVMLANKALRLPTWGES